LIKKILNTFGTKTITAFINLAIAIVLSQYLGAEGKGEQGLIITTIAFVLVFANLIGGATLVYLTPRIAVKHLIAPSYLWSALISIFAYFTLRFTNIIDQSFVIHISILAFLNSILAINSSILIGNEKDTYS